MSSGSFGAFIYNALWPRSLQSGAAERGRAQAGSPRGREHIPTPPPPRKYAKTTAAGTRPAFPPPLPGARPWGRPFQPSGRGRPGASLRRAARAPAGPAVLSASRGNPREKPDRIAGGSMERGPADSGPAPAAWQRALGDSPRPCQSSSVVSAQLPERVPCLFIGSFLHGGERSGRGGKRQPRSHMENGTA